MALPDGVQQLSYPRSPSRVAQFLTQWYVTPSSLAAIEHALLSVKSYSCSLLAHASAFFANASLAPGAAHLRLAPLEEFFRISAVFFLPSMLARRFAFDSGVLPVTDSCAPRIEPPLRPPKLHAITVASTCEMRPANPRHAMKSSSLALRCHSAKCHMACCVGVNSTMFSSTYSPPS